MDTTVHVSIFDTAVKVQRAGHNIIVGAVFIGLD